MPNTFNILDGKILKPESNNSHIKFVVSDTQSIDVHGDLAVAIPFNSTGGTAGDLDGDGKPDKLVIGTTGNGGLLITKDENSINIDSDGDGDVDIIIGKPSI